MEEKIFRFLELSEKFSKTEDEAIGAEMFVLNRYKETKYNMSFNSTRYTRDIILRLSENNTETETVEVLAEKMLTRIKEYQEYRQLQKDLLEYYKAKQKLN